MKKTTVKLWAFLGLIAILLCGCTVTFSDEGSETSTSAASLEDLPTYEEAAQPYVEVNNNVPMSFSASEITEESFEYYSELDELGRCGVCYACIGQDLMPTEERGSIGQVKPSGWHTYRYDCVDGQYLYNRCHLIGYQLSGENANRQNLITGTRYLNVDGMLPFENLVADYVEDTGNHVMYYVTPVFTGDNLVADGVLMEGMSVEDQGEDIQFCVFCYNNQPGVDIDYATGESCLSENSDCGSQRASHHEEGHHNGKHHNDTNCEPAA